MADGELAWTSFNNALRIFTNNRPNFKSNDGNFHPTQKSIGLMRFCIEYADKNSGHENKTILDCFSGSFTTAVACKELKRNWIGIEINPEYCKMGEKRINQTVVPFL